MVGEVFLRAVGRGFGNYSVRFLEGCVLVGGAPLQHFFGRDLRTWEAGLDWLAARLGTSPAGGLEVGFGSECSKNGHF